jgi:glucosyl-dolichyl phosphate glucuronosyltransferase
MISIIIPTCNRCKSLKITLESILNQDFVRDFEVIVVDNGSIDETKNICAEFSPTIKNFIYHYDEVPGLLTGRHKGAMISSGEILSFIDDDVELSTGWLNGIDDCFRESPDVHFVTGPNLPKYESYPPPWLNYFWNTTPYGGKMCTWLSLLDLGHEKIEVDPTYVFGLNFSIRKQTLFELKGFHPDCIPSHLQQFQGDGETGLSIKGRRLGYKAIYTPKALLYHCVPSSRLSAEYFEKRAYYAGVCNSYTALRDKDFTRIVPAVSIIQKRKKVRIVKDWLVSIKGKLNQYFGKAPIGDALPESIIELKRILYDREKQGYEFHQKAFHSDEQIRQWVLRDNYFDYRLPIYDRTV